MRKVKFRWSQELSWQHRIFRETFFYICIKMEKKKPQPSLVSSCLLRERKKRLTLAVYFLCLETPGLPACY
ncbi:MAG: hypothetical protein PWK00_10975, partial [Coxiella burnetii]|nr:hypothetical protein [Coxiella burnetii]